MKDYTRKLLDKVLDAIEAAEGLMDMGKAEFSAGRAYYAMFYIAEALFSEKGLEFKQHGRVIGAYGLHFAKTKELDPNIIAGSQTDSIPVSREIMAWTPELITNLWQT
ncbi:MAG: HEPN domain-containing protein [Chloroflexi bacterium]|nr:HEPN domain-containing protein [Chloroflexota bacterium]